MRAMLFVFLSQALFCTLVFGHHAVDHHDDHHDDHHHSNETTHSLQIASSNFKFAFQLYSHLATKYPTDNLFFSPFSISVIFSMLSVGAKSQTRSQLLETLGFNTSLITQEDINKGFQQLLNILNQPNDDLQFNSANALFTDKGAQLLGKFLYDVKKFYHSEAICMNFQKSEEAKNQINSYVEKKTDGKIKDLLDSLDAQTILVLINTIFFRGSWEHAFNENFTREEDFHVDKNTAVKVPMMKRKGEYLVAFPPEMGCVVVDVPYKGNISAILILPDAGKLHDVEKALQNVSLQAWTKLMKPMTISLSIPKFSISATLDLKDELSEMGATDVFSDHADLSGITGEHNLKVSKAVHKAVLNVDEKGTEAAAATAVVITRHRLPRPIVFTRPFLLTILNRSPYSILFTGRIVNPKK